jgi:hypothetical protein
VRGFFFQNLAPETIASAIARPLYSYFSFKRCGIDFDVLGALDLLVTLDALVDTLDVLDALNARDDCLSGPTTGLAGLTSVHTAPFQISFTPGMGRKLSSKNPSRTRWATSGAK